MFRMSEVRICVRASSVLCSSIRKQNLVMPSWLHSRKQNHLEDYGEEQVGLLFSYQMMTWVRLQNMWEKLML